MNINAEREIGIIKAKCSRYCYCNIDTLICFLQMSRADSDIYEIWNIGDKIFDFFYDLQSKFSFLRHF